MNSLNSIEMVLDEPGQVSGVQIVPVWYALQVGALAPGLPQAFEQTAQHIYARQAHASAHRPATEETAYGKSARRGAALGTVAGFVQGRLRGLDLDVSTSGVYQVLSTALGRFSEE